LSDALQLELNFKHILKIPDTDYGKLLMKTSDLWVGSALATIYGHLHKLH